ncbi:photoreceptor ankyrin repeat protein isoform X2 [Sphaerodactylus townsendi]|uniref:photoreceptor ankyrin repeat protein isoform X2 n=1 Tax=Sphaerodactylus townsendi TaxID=933632 RepID=UPI0020267F41|nr:photoreceptor ankyrin repeat protein isoform X2 [Sphaerodactylus townsendi]
MFPKNGLMVACYKGFIDIVTGLSKCPYVNVNHQDNDGNTALMIASQAGFSAIVTYLLNYYPALEIEMRDHRGLTALMKAAMQGKNDCVSALLLAGADLTAVDPLKKKTAQEWATLTGRFETTLRFRALLQRPCAEQFSNKYSPEWPALSELVAQELAKSRTQCLSEKIRAMFTFTFPHDPEPDGVLDHMVRTTTCLASPFVATACQTVCPDSPPEVGKHRLSVPEILNEYTPDPDAKSMVGESSCNGQLTEPTWVLVPYRPRSTIMKFLSLPLRLHSNSVYPGGIPKIKLTKSPAQNAEKLPKSSSCQNTLKLPRWRYQEVREEKKKTEEAAGKPKKKSKKKKRRKGKS